MPRGIHVLGLALASALALAADARAATVTVDKAIPAEVYVKSAGRAAALRGALVKFDEQSFTLRVGSEDRTLAWTDITPATAFSLRQKTIDKNRATDCLALGEFGWSIGAKDQAQAVLLQAVRLDASLKPKVDAVLATAAGARVTAAPPRSRELIVTGESAAKKVPANEDDDGPPDAAQKFKPASPEEAAAAMAASRQQAAGIETKVGVKLTEAETEHFLIFTDWDTREYDFLKTNLEGAYRVVAKQFATDPKATVFVGKLPVYMFARYDDFDRFATDVDRFPVSTQTAGYYMGNRRTGIGHMAMWKPNESLTGTPDISAAERLWAYVLVHEFTHAFLARYRSNEFVPPWLNEGLAELIADNQFPYPDRRRFARTMAQNGVDVSPLFERRHRPTGEAYPVMRSMVELLVIENRQNFLKMIDAIKDGQAAEDALRAQFRVNYAEFATWWRDWARKRRD